MGARYLCLLMGLLLGLVGNVWGQASPFQVSVEPLEIAGMPGLQSFAYGEHAGLWLLMGGRTDGLHRRQPFAAFDSAGRNEQLVVVSPTAKRVWMAPLTGLSNPIQEHLCATNQQFHQTGNYLYVLGGYGYSPTLGDHKTFDCLTAIDVAGAISAIQTQGDLKPYFRQISDPRFRVTGGQLGRIGDFYYLIGGHDFHGRYNPVSHDFGPGFQQTYNHTRQCFAIDDNGKEVSIRFLEAWTDSAHFHRRDYNLVPLINGNREALMIFSGVFQIHANIPFLNCTEVREDMLIDCIDFQQHYQQYHCAHFPLYAEGSKEMHTVFLGGIGEYYDSTGIHVQDYGVPFVKTIARVTREADGRYREYRLPVEMPDFIGASAEFIPVPGLPMYRNGVIKLDSLSAEKQLVGYLVGGVRSSGDNIFWMNEGDLSAANTKIYAIFLAKSPSAPADHLNPSSNSRLHLEVLPNPYKALLKLDFYHSAYGDVGLRLLNTKGKTIFKHKVAGVAIGQQHLEIPCKPLKKGGRFLLEMEVDGTTTVLGLVVEP